MAFASVEEFLSYVHQRDAGQPEFLQAVEEVLRTLWPFLQANSRYLKMGLLERLVEPERVIQFRVPWQDDAGNVRVNRGFRVQMNSAIGPYKGGIRFHPSVNVGILKFLAFEQTFKNALTTLPMGGGKGGSDFDPHGKSEGEVMRFCQSFMTELFRHIGGDTDVPAGDIGVGAREVGFMFGQYKRLANEFVPVLTGRGLSYGGSLIRPEATGYGAVYFTEAMLARRGDTLEGKRVTVSGSGNVAQYAVRKALEMHAKVLSVSDSAGTVHFRNGMTQDHWQALMALKNERRGRVSELASIFDGDAEFLPGKRPWHIPCDIAMPCATQNELGPEDAKALIANGCQAVVEGANMPTTLEAVNILHAARVLYAPGKAANAGGVAVSGFEMSQGKSFQHWTAPEVDARLHTLMHSIHHTCLAHGEEADGFVNYMKGANIAGFVKVADAMLAQGVV